MQGIEMTIDWSKYATVDDFWNDTKTVYQLLEISDERIALVTEATKESMWIEIAEDSVIRFATKSYNINENDTVTYGQVEYADYTYEVGENGEITVTPIENEDNTSFARNNSLKVKNGVITMSQTIDGITIALDFKLA